MAGIEDVVGMRGRNHIRVCLALPSASLEWGFVRKDGRVEQCLLSCGSEFGGLLKLQSKTL